jgi:hypothetical protein
MRFSPVDQAQTFGAPMDCQGIARFGRETEQVVESMAAAAEVNSCKC